MKKVFGGLVIITLSWIFTNLGIQTVKAASYIYVDSASQSTSSDGTETTPYKDISSALTKAGQNGTGDRKIFIKKGTYASTDLTLPAYTELLGEDKNEVIIDFSASDTSDLTMGKKTKIEKLTVKGGNYSVVVPKKNKVTINNVKVTDSKRIGIWVKSGKNRTMYAVTIKDSTIENSEGKGVFIEQTYLYFYNNAVTDNDEEGLDLRASVKGKIYDNEFLENGEGGMETEIRKVSLELRNNDFKDNKASGILLNNRTNTGGKIYLKDNNIDGNNNYGIRCAGTRSWSNKLWKKTVTLKNNDLSDNDSGDIDSACAYK